MPRRYFSTDEHGAQSVQTQTVHLPDLPQQNQLWLFAVLGQPDQISQTPRSILHQLGREPIGTDRRAEKLAVCAAAGGFQLKAHRIGKPQAEIGHPAAHLVLCVHPGHRARGRRFHNRQIFLQGVVGEDAITDGLKILQVTLDLIGKQRDHLGTALVQPLIIGLHGNAQGSHGCGAHQRNGQQQNQLHLCPHPQIPPYFGQFAHTFLPVDFHSIFPHISRYLYK